MPDEAVVVDADGHTMEPHDLWSARMDRKRWGDWVPRKVVEDEVYETYYAGGSVRGGGRELQDAMAAAVGMTPRQFHDMLQSLRVPGGHDPDARVADMDRDGIDVAVLYPSTALFFGPDDPIDAFHDVEFVLDCQRAYNDWVAEYCAAHPRRDRKSTRLNSSHANISYAVFCLKKKKKNYIFFFFFFFFFNDTATTEIYTLSLHDALRSRLPARVQRLGRRVLRCTSAS